MYSATPVVAVVVAKSEGESVLEDWKEDVPEIGGE